MRPRKSTTPAELAPDGGRQNDPIPLAGERSNYRLEGLNVNPSVAESRIVRSDASPWS